MWLFLPCKPFAISSHSPIVLAFCSTLKNTGLVKEHGANLDFHCCFGYYYYCRRGKRRSSACRWVPLIERGKETRDCCDINITSINSQWVAGVWFMDAGALSVIWLKNGQLWVRPIGDWWNLFSFQLTPVRLWLLLSESSSSRSRDFFSLYFFCVYEDKKSVSATMCVWCLMWEPKPENRTGVYLIAWKLQGSSAVGRHAPFPITPETWKDVLLTQSTCRRRLFLAAQKTTWHQTIDAVCSTALRGLVTKIQCRWCCVVWAIGWDTEPDPFLHDILSDGTGTHLFPTEIKTPRNGSGCYVSNKNSAHRASTSLEPGSEQSRTSGAYIHDGWRHLLPWESRNRRRW